MRVWAFLSTGMGGIDFGGLDAAAVLFDLPDDELEMLLHRLDVIKHRLDVIKHHSPPKH